MRYLLRAKLSCLLSNEWSNPSFLWLKSPAFSDQMNICISHKVLSYWPCQTMVIKFWLLFRIVLCSFVWYRQNACPSEAYHLNKKQQIKTRGEKVHLLKCERITDMKKVEFSLLLHGQICGLKKDKNVTDPRLVVICSDLQPINLVISF